MENNGELGASGLQVQGGIDGFRLASVKADGGEWASYLDMRWGVQGFMIGDGYNDGLDYLTTTLSW